MKILITVMLVSLLPLAEIYLFIYMSRFTSTNLLIAALLISALAGLVISFTIIKSILRQIKTEINNGNYPEELFYRLAGSITAGLLLITPGFIGDIAGLLMLFPGINSNIGIAVTKPVRPALKEIYEYIKLYEIQ